MAHSKMQKSWTLGTALKAPVYQHCTGFSASFLASTFEKRLFSTSPITWDWLIPKAGENKRGPKGRPRVHTGGSVRGTTVVWGDYGLRMRDRGRRISAMQLRVAAETIAKRLRGMRYTLYKRINAGIGVYTKGNESRMGTGKGSFDHWSARVAVSRILFELKGDLHEQVVKDAFRLAGNKLPGLYEFVKRGDPPVMGITKVTSAAVREQLMRPRKPLPAPNKVDTASRIPEPSNGPVSEPLPLQ